MKAAKKKKAVERGKIRGASSSRRTTGIEGASKSTMESYLSMLGGSSQASPTSTTYAERFSSRSIAIANSLLNESPERFRTFLLRPNEPATLDSALIENDRPTAILVALLITNVYSGLDELVSSVRLQGLLYYCQAWHLAIYGEPLFNENVVATPHGALVPSIFSAGIGGRPDNRSELLLRRMRTRIPTNQLQEIAGFVSEVLEAYSGLNAVELSSQICSEQPWQSARKGLSFDDPTMTIIDESEMKSFYASRLVKDDG